MADDNLERLIEQLSKLDRAGKMAQVTLERLRSEAARNPSESAYRNIQDELAYINQLARTYLDLLEKIRVAQRQAAGGGVYGHTPGGATGGPTPDTPPPSTGPTGPQIKGAAEQFRKSLEKIFEALRKEGYENIQSAELIGGIGDEASKLRVRAAKPDDMPQNFSFFADAMGNYGRTLKELRRNIIINNPKYKELFEQARKVGFSPENLTGFKDEGGGAFSRAQFRRYVGGVQYEQGFNVGRAGDVSMAPNQSRYRSFTQSVGKDIGDLLKWSIAISAIYAPINAASEAMQQLIENETKLADVSIALNTEIASTNTVFTSVRGSADIAGESISGVIDAFGQAYRAAGRIQDPIQRYNSSVKLLNDSLVLSKISTLDQAQAIDLLTAGLFQAGQAGESAEVSFARSTTILDQWVKVSKIANVDIATLATGVAVLGDSAEAAGLKLEELNALVAVITEVSPAAGKEAANIAKALVGNYQQPEAVRALNRIGVAVKDVTGKNREFLDVMKDVAALRSQNLLSDQDFQRVTLALGGGGIRRQADVARFIENFGRVGQIVSAQQNAQGESAQALAKRLDTVQTSATRLGNAFTGLGQTLGTSGGLLDVFSSTLDMATQLVTILDKLSDSIGKTAPLLAGLAAGALILGGKGNLTAKLANNFTIPLAGRLGAQNYIGSGLGMAEMLTGQRNILGGQVSSRIGQLGTLPSLAAIGVPAYQNFKSGETAKGVADLVGGALGAVAAGPAGALIGAAIAEAFVNATITRKGEFVDFFSGVVQETKTEGEKPTAQKSIEEVTKDVFKTIGGGAESLGILKANIALIRSRTERSGGVAQEVPGSYKNQFSAAMAILEQQDPELAKQVRSRFAAQGGTQAGAPTYLSRRQEEIQQDKSTMDYLRQLQTGRQDTMRNQLITGEIKPAEYARQLASMSAYSETATRYMAALVDDSGKLGEKFTSASAAYQSFLEILSSGNEELIGQLNSQISAIEYYQELLSTWTPGTEIENKLTGEMFTPENMQAIKDLLDQVRTGYANTINFGAQQVRLQNIKTPEVFGSYLNPTPQKDLNLVLQETLKAQEKRYAELNPEDYQALVDSFETFAVLVKDAGSTFFDKVTGIDKSIFQEVFQKLQKEGKIEDTSGGGPDFQTVGVTLAQLLQAIQQSQLLGASLQNKYGYQPNLQDVIFMTSDKQTTQAHVDMKLLQYILGQILETEKKQLEGLYNLPEGATFWVPITAAWLAPRKNEGGGLSQELLDALMNQQQEETVTPPTQFSVPRADQRYEYYGERRELPPPKYTPPTTTPERYDLYGERRQMGTGGVGKETELSLFQQLLQALNNGKPSVFEQATGAVKGKEGEQSLAQQALSALSGLGPTLQAILNTFTALHGGSGGGLGAVGRNPLDQSGAVQAAAPPTKFDIRFASTTQLIVDGRVLASIIKPYLATDMANTNETGGTITRSYVI